MLLDDDEENVNATLERDRRRWDACKNSGDDRLLYTDASCFLHPELHDKMKKILAQVRNIFLMHCRF